MKPTRFFQILFVLFLLSSTRAFAQPQTGQFLNASIGLGITAPYDDFDMTGNGFYAQGEYVFGLASWFGVRPYAGVVIASGDKQLAEGTPVYNIKTNAFVIGAKARIAAPIPYVAPFFESGIGMSVGSFETYTPETNIKKSGIIHHIPVTLGLALGRQHNIELKLTYYYHPAADQFAGAFAAGFSFPMD